MKKVFCHLSLLLQPYHVAFRKSRAAHDRSLAHLFEHVFDFGFLVVGEVELSSHSIELLLNRLGATFAGLAFCLWRLRILGYCHIRAGDQQKKGNGGEEDR